MPKQIQNPGAVIALIQTLVASQDMAFNQATRAAGVSVPWAIKKAEEMGIDIPRKSGFRYPKVFVDKVVAEYRSGKPIKDIAKDNDCSHAFINIAAKKAGCLPRLDYTPNPWGASGRPKRIKPEKLKNTIKAHADDTLTRDNRHTLMVTLHTKKVVAEMARRLGVSQKEFIVEAVNNYTRYLST